MDRDEASRRRDAALKRIDELLRDRLPEPPREPEQAALELPAAPRTPRPRPRSRTAERRRAGTLEGLLLEFTPETAYAFIYDHTVPPATEDGLALLASYPELSISAPELVADMAVAFRNKPREQYAAFFALVARHHGLHL